MNPDDLRIVLLWEAGRDTMDISYATGRQECDVYNVLPRLRALRFENRVRKPVTQAP